MIIKSFIESLKSVFLRSLIGAPGLNKPILFNMFFVVLMAIISIILAEIFLGLSIYKLSLECNWNERAALLITTLMYGIQVVISILAIKHHIKKVVKENVIIKDYKLIKGVLSALIEGYKNR